MRLQISRLHCDDAIVSGMRFIKTVASELLPIIENGVGSSFGDVICHRAVHELPAVLHELIPDFFAHSLAQIVGLLCAVTGQSHGRKHELLLIHRPAIGLLEKRLQGGMQIGDFFLAVHAPDIVRDEIHRPGTIKRHHGNHVLQTSRLHGAQKAAHARALDLKDAGHVATPQQLKTGRVIGTDVVQVQFNVVTLMDEFTRPRHHRQRA